MDRWHRIAWLLAFGALLCVTGCGGAADQTAAPAPAPEEAPPAPEEGRGFAGGYRTVAEPVREPQRRVGADPAVPSDPAGVEPDRPNEMPAPAREGTPDTPRSEPAPQTAARTSEARSEARDPGASRQDRERPSRPESSYSPVSSKPNSAPLVALGGVPAGTVPHVPDEAGVPDPGQTVDQTAKAKVGVGAAPPPPLPTEEQDPKVDQTPDETPEPDPPMVAQVVLQPNMLDVAPGASLSFHIWIYGAEQTASVPFHLLFNPEVLQFQGAHEGPFLAGDGRATVFMVAGTSDGQSVVVGHSRLTRDTGANGNGELCVLNFVALAEGDPGLAFDRAKVIDVTGQDQPSLFQVQSPVIR